MNPLYYALTVGTGCVLSLMLVINGSLGLLSGLLLSSVIIHFVGLLGAWIVLLAKRQVPFRHRKVALFLYSGGFFGVATVLLFNAAFGHISVTAMVALGLLGQGVTSLVVDHFGLLGLQKRPVNVKQIPGLIVAAAGIALMLQDFNVASLFSALLAFLTGLSVVASRIINGVLAKETTPSLSAWYNHLVGLGVSALVLALAGFPGHLSLSEITTGNLWMFTGGFLGVLIVTLSNFLIHHISAYSMALLTFLGQIFTSILLDTLLKDFFSPLEFLAGIIIAVGFGLNATMGKGQLKSL